METDAHLLRDFRSVDVGADGVKSDTGLGVAHFGLEKCGDEGGGHLAEGFTLLLPAGAFDSFGDFGKVAFQGGLQEGAFVGEVLVQGADGDASAQSDPGSGEPLFSDPEQNLNRGLENGFHAGSRTGLYGRFAGL